VAARNHFRKDFEALCRLGQNDRRFTAVSEINAHNGADPFLPGRFQEMHRAVKTVGVRKSQEGVSRFRSRSAKVTNGTHPPLERIMRMNMEMGERCRHGFHLPAVAFPGAAGPPEAPDGFRCGAPRFENPSPAAPWTAGASPNPLPQAMASRPKRFRTASSAF